MSLDPHDGPAARSSSRRQPRQASVGLSVELSQGQTAKGVYIYMATEPTGVVRVEGVASEVCERKGAKDTAGLDPELVFGLKLL